MSACSRYDYKNKTIIECLEVSLNQILTIVLIYDLNLILGLCPTRRPVVRFSLKEKFKKNKVLLW